MPRQLKFHEQKLLKKVDYVTWKSDPNNVNEGAVMRKYAIRKRAHYVTYNKLSREIREVASKIRDLPDKDPNKKRLTNRLLSKLYNVGLIPAIDSLEQANTVTASSFCRRRLSTVLVREKMAKNPEEGAKFVEQGHIRVGAELITDPAFLVTRTMSDLVTWANASKIRQHVEEYNNMRDDFDG